MDIARKSGSRAGKTTVLRDRQLDEEVFRRVFPSGLTVYVVRKPEFTRRP